MKIPAQYLPVMPYLIINDGHGSLSFVKTVFDAKEQLIVKAEDGSIMHGEFRVEDAVIMFGQANDVWKAKSAGMYLYVQNVDKVYKKALEMGARSLDAPYKKEYGYTAGFEDPFDNHWFIVEP